MTPATRQTMIARALEKARVYGREHPETLTMAIVPPRPGVRCA